MSPAAGMHVPLLPEGKVLVKPASVSGAVFNVATSIIGAGIMSIPATLKVLGVIPAFVMILVIGLLAEVSVDFLMRFSHSGNTTTYAGVMREAFGPAGAFAAQICVMITNLGCLIMYLIIIGDVLSGNSPGGEVHLGILQQWLGIHWWTSREFALLVIVFVMLPLVLYRRLESLRFSSAISTLLAVAFVGICSGMAITALMAGKTYRPRLLPELNSHTSFFDLFTAVPVIVTAFTFHFNVHPIGFELAQPSDMTVAVRIALVLCGAIYFAIGLFGYLLFGDSTQSDILINFDQNTAGSATGSLLNTLVRLSYAFHIMLVFPLLNFSLRANIDELLFPKKPLLATDNKRFVILTLVLLVFSYLIAIAFPDIWYFFQFVGSTSAVCLAFIFPGSLALRDAHGISKRNDKITALIMIILAIITSVIAISTNIYHLFSSKS
ncbi:amino acid transporter AVT6C-like [Neltuma alba]|uniref:amino acid transporter AVT6C-like n=1 Tax=Neltuma alba TaxID=207710 RepID=UPI0010A2CE86|nr:amino acid transporter AVT6C-like [Prosopis alba]XP_028778812.1 amino acid transporter AVT6C-like [Prosopis alba]